MSGDRWWNVKCRWGLVEETDTLMQCLPAQPQAINGPSAEGGVKHLKAVRGPAHSGPRQRRAERWRKQSNAVVVVVEQRGPGSRPKGRGGVMKEWRRRRGRKTNKRSLVLPGCPGGWARLSSVLNACRSLFLRFTILLWGISLKMTEKDRQDEKSKKRSYGQKRRWPAVRRRY